MPTMLQRISGRWLQWRTNPDRIFLLWISLELVGVSVAISVLEYLSGWHALPMAGISRSLPWLNLTPPLPLPGFGAIVLFRGLFWLQPRLWPWPQWRVPLWLTLFVAYWVLCSIAGHFLLLNILISGYGILAYARITRSPFESYLTFALIVAAVALGVWRGDTLSGLHFGIWGLGAIFVLSFTGLGMRERVARQESETFLAELQIAHQQLRDYAEQVAENATLSERERMAREIHDTLVQGLAATVMHLDAALETQAIQPATARELISRARTLARDTMRESRAAILAIAPATPLIDRLAALRNDTPVDLTVSSLPNAVLFPWCSMRYAGVSVRKACATL